MEVIDYHKTLAPFAKVVIICVFLLLLPFRNDHCLKFMCTMLYEVYMKLPTRFRPRGTT